MNKVEFKPNFSSQAQMLFKILPWLTVFSILVVSVIYFLIPVKSADLLTWVFVLPIIVGSIWLFRLLYGWDIRNRLITIAGAELTYSYSSLPWSTGRQTVDLKNVKLIKEGYGSRWAGKTAVVFYTYEFFNKDGTNQKLQMSAWDKSSLKNLLNYIKRNFPDISIESKLL